MEPKYYFAIVSAIVLSLLFSNLTIANAFPTLSPSINATTPTLSPSINATTPTTTPLPSKILTNGTASLKVITHVSNKYGGAAKASDFYARISGNTISSIIKGSETGTILSLRPGNYTVDEAKGPSGYILKLSGDCGGTVKAGENLTCTLEHADNLIGVAKLTVITHVINNVGGNATAKNFTYAVKNATGIRYLFSGKESPGTIFAMKTGPYSVTERPIGVLLHGYSSKTSAGCSGVMHVGDQKTCVLTNNYIKTGGSNKTIQPPTTAKGNLGTQNHTGNNTIITPNNLGTTKPSLQASQQPPQFIRLYSPSIFGTKYRITLLYNYSGKDVAIYNSDFKFESDNYTSFLISGTEFKIQSNVGLQSHDIAHTPRPSDIVVKLTPLLNATSTATYMTDIHLGAPSITLPYGPDDHGSHTFFVLSKIPAGKYLLDVYAYFPNFKLYNVYTTKTLICKPLTRCHP